MGASQSRMGQSVVKAARTALGKPDPRAIKPMIVAEHAKDVQVTPNSLDTPKMKTFDASVSFKKDATFELSEEDYEMMMLKQKDPEKAEQLTRELNEQFKERIDNQAEQFDTSMIDPEYRDFSTPKPPKRPRPINQGSIRSKMYQVYKK